MSTSIDGLVSGLNTTQMISQLMAVERLPEQQLQSQKSTDQTMVAKLQGLNTLFSTLQTAAAALVPDVITKASAWTAHAVSSSDTSIATATAGDTSVPGTVTFAVTSVATAGQAITSGGVTTRTDAVSDGPIVLTKGTASTTLSLAAGATIDDVATAINGANAGVAATVVQDSTGTFRLQLTSTTTGKATDVSLDAGTLSGGASPLGSSLQLTAAADTVLHVGTGPGAYDVSSATRGVSGLLPGVTINVTKAAPATQVTLTVSSDSASMADKVKGLVDAANAALSEIDKQSAYDPSSKSAGPLLGDSFVRSLRQRVVDSVIGTSTSTPAMQGVSVTKEGTIAFDRDAFLAAYAKDPATAQATLTTMAQQIADSSQQASDPVSGQITVRVQNYQDDVRDVTGQITAFEDRMTLKQQALQTQFSNLEVALGQLQSQSQWLAGQLGSLPSTSSSSK